MDGGSTDDTLEILESFGRDIAFRSEPDGGQAAAIEAGIKELDFELVGWLNADDELVPGAISAICRARRRFPSCALYHGNIDEIDERGRVIGHRSGAFIDYSNMRRQRGKVLQPGSFMDRKLVLDSGGIDETWHLLMDLDLWIRILRRGSACWIDQTLSRFRVHAAAKSSQPPYRYHLESLRIGVRHEKDNLGRSMLRRLGNGLVHHARWMAGAS